MYRSFQTPPEYLIDLFALARMSSQSEFFSDFGKVTTIGFQTLKNHKCKIYFIFAFLESTLGGESTLGVCEIGQTIEICRIPLSSGNSGKLRFLIRYVQGAVTF